MQAMTFAYDQIHVRLHVPHMLVLNMQVSPRRACHAGQTACPNGLLAQNKVQRQLRCQAKLVLLVIGRVQSVWSVQSTTCESTSQISICVRSDLEPACSGQKEP